MKKSLIIIALLIFSSAKAQEKDSSFYSLDKSSMQSNVLYTWPDSGAWGRLNGTSNANIKNLYVLQLYKELKNYENDDSLMPIDSIYAKARYEQRVNKRIPLLMISYLYDRLKQNALSDSLITFSGKRFNDVADRSESPFEAADLFASGPLAEKLNGTVNFFISKDFFITNKDLPVKMEIDFGDGLGYRIVSWETTFAVTYTPASSKNIETRLTYANGNVMKVISVPEPEYCWQTGHTYPQIDESIIVSSSIPFYDPSQQILHPIASYSNLNGIAVASAYVYFGNGHAKGNFEKPIIFIEGIDFGYTPYNLQDDNGRHIRNGDFGWCEFWGQSYSDADPNNPLIGFTEFKNSPALLNRLHDEGYDIILVDFWDGADFIERNSMTVIELLQQIKQRQATGGYYHKPAVLVGASMGGQVGKYALSYMEQHNMKHCVREYMSFDSPHQGASIPMSLQYWIEFFAHNGENGGDEAAQRNLAGKINRPAARQLLVDHYHDPIMPFLSQDRLDFASTMQNIGYPQKLRRTAISSGSVFGENQLYLQAGDKLLSTSWTPNACLNTTFLLGDCFSTPTTNSILFVGKVPKNGAAVLSCLLLGSVSCSLCASTNIGFDVITRTTNVLFPNNAPGGYRNTALFIEKEFNENVPFLLGNPTGTANANPNGHPEPPNECFIPTISALDINSTNYNFNVNMDIFNKNVPYPGVYPFEAYYASSINRQHVFLEAYTNGTDVNNSNADWALNEILRSEPILPQVLSGSSLNNGLYNLASYTRRYLTSVSVAAGGKLYINGNLQKDFGNATVPFPLEGVSAPTPAGTTLEVEVCDCDNVKVTVESGGLLELGATNGNKAIVRFKAGSTLEILSGSTLVIHDGSQLIIEEGANLVLSLTANIILAGPSALFDVQGNQTTVQRVASGGSWTLDNGSPNLNNQGGIMKIREATFEMEQGSQLINRNCRLQLGNSSKMIYHPGADIQLLGNSSELEIQGKLEIKNNANFTFSYPGTNKSGFINFNLSNPTDITAGANTQFNMAGENKNDLVLKISGTDIYIPSNVQQVSTNKCMVQGPGGFVPYGLSTGISLTETKFFGTRIVQLSGQPQTIVDKCDFESCPTGIKALLLYGGAPLKISSSKFLGCGTGIYSHGKGLNIEYCTIKNSGTNGWEAHMMTMPCLVKNSIIGGSTIDRNDENGILYSGSPTAPLTIENSTISNNWRHGVEVTGARVNVKCSRVKENSQSGLVLNNGASLNASTLQGYNAGNNDMQGNERTIFANNARMLFLDNGKNDLKSATSAACMPGNHGNIGYCYTMDIEGTLSLGYDPCKPITNDCSDILVPAWQNHWNGIKNGSINHPTGQSATDQWDYDLKTSYSCATFYQQRKIKLIDPNPKSFTSCPLTSINENALANMGNNASGIIASCPGCQVITTNSFNNKKINVATLQTLDTMEMGASLKHKKSVNLFHEILDYNYQVTGSEDLEVLNYAVDKMDEALGYSFMENEVQPLQSGLTVESQKAVDIHNERIVGSPCPIDYDNQMNERVAQGQIYRLNEKYDAALTIFNDILLWVQPRDQNYLEYLICMTNVEKQIQSGQLTKENYEQFAMSCKANSTARLALAQPGLNELVVGETKDDLKLNFSPTISIAPNPSSGSFLINYSNTSTDENSQIVIKNIFGQVIKKYTITESNEGRIDVDLSMYSGGIYFCIMEQEGKIVAMSKIILK